MMIELVAIMLSKPLQNTILKSNSLTKVIPLMMGLLVIGWLLNTPTGLLGKADAIGYAVCHRIDLRSFHIGDRQLSLCARCTGQYLGAMLGIVFQLIRGRRRAGKPPWAVIALFILFGILYAMDGINSYIHLIPNLSHFYIYDPNNTLRLVTGMGMGLSISAVLIPIFHQTVWSSWDGRSAFEGLRTMVWLLVAAAGLVLMILLEHPVILYPLTIMSASGVLILLTMIYTVVLFIIIGWENRIQSVRQLILPLMIGFTLAMSQIALFDFLRYLITGTWDGFHIG